MKQPTTFPLQRPSADARRPQCAMDCVLRLEADHRVANHLAMLASYLRLKSAEFEQPGPLGRDAVRLFTQSVDAQIQAVARLHRMLTSPDRDADIDVATVLREVCGPFAGGLDRNVTIIQDFSATCGARPEQVLQISQLVGEAITNALKHAFPGRRAGVLLIRSRPVRSGGVLIEVKDDGVGLPATFDAQRDGGFGFHLMRGLSRGLAAQLNFCSGPDGLRVSLTLEG